MLLLWLPTRVSSQSAAATFRSEPSDAAPTKFLLSVLSASERCEAGSSAMSINSASEETDCASATPARYGALVNLQ